MKFFFDAIHIVKLHINDDCLAFASKNQRKSNIIRFFPFQVFFLEEQRAAEITSNTIITPAKKTQLDNLLSKNFRLNHSSQHDLA